MTLIYQDNDAEFTEANYRRLLVLAAERYAFCDYGQEAHDRRSVAWRHDVDYSPHRALALARMENAQGLRCIYHVLPTGRYYNVLEPEIAEIFHDIAELGHFLGLHFDLDVFGEQIEVDADAVVRRITLEKEILEAVTGAQLRSMSFHNYGLNQGRLLELETICGMTNIAAHSVRSQYKYVSDSNGIWRFDRLEDVLGQDHRRLHVLTHPEWWTPTAMSPLDRLDRCIAGRARAARRFYADVMKRDGRYADIAARIGFGEGEA
jgi:hypothetical protein